jgi:hypothetical protein
VDESLRIRDAVSLDSGSCTSPVSDTESHFDAMLVIVVALVLYGMSAREPWE